MAVTGNEAVTLKQLKEVRDDISNRGGGVPGRVYLPQCKQHKSIYSIWWYVATDSRCVSPCCWKSI